MFQCLGRIKDIGGCLGLELQAVVRHPVWVLGAELSSSGRAAVLVTAELSIQPPPFIKQKLEAAYYINIAFISTGVTVILSLQHILPLNGVRQASVALESDLVLMFSH